MSDIFDSWSSGNSIFSNKSAVLETFIPERILHREDEIQTIVDTLRPAVVRNERPENMFVSGLSGLGKTASVRYIFEEMAERTDEVLPVYVNCWGLNSAHQLLLELLPNFTRKVPSRGVSTHELFARLVKAMKRSSRLPVIALDEFDRFLDSDNILYEFSRMEHEIQPGIIIITSGPYRVSDSRARSSMGGVCVKYEPYKLSELTDIITDRVKLAFRPGTVDQKSVEKICNFAHKRNSDVRIALTCLRIAGEFAEAAGSKQVEDQHLEKALSRVVDGDVYTTMSLLGDTERDIIYAVALKGSMKSGDLYSAFNKRSEKEMSQRNFRRYISKLQKLRVIDTKPTGEGERGQSRFISLLLDPEEVKRAYVKLLG